MSPLEPGFAGLLPHPPVVVPEVGRDRLEECRRTHDACQELSERCLAAEPSRLVLISPHSPRQRGAFGIWSGARLRGDLGRFGAPEASVDLPRDPAAAERIRDAARARGLNTWSISDEALDHGAVVPLCFLVRAGFVGPTTVISLPAYPDVDELTQFGRAIADALAGLPGRPAVIASGDMTHRATEDAPAGYHPDAIRFDRTLCEHVAAGRLADIPDIDPSLREVAAEDATDSSTIVASALGFHARGAKILSYEHPFGVGYLVAVFHDGAERSALEPLLTVARSAIRAELEGRGGASLPPAAGELRRPASLFVTLRKDGELRGCTGSLTAPERGDMVTEAARCAVASALRDPRFAPLTREELDECTIEINVLGEMELIDDPSELDPGRYGVVVGDGNGQHAVLLPGIEGIDDVDTQLQICRRKAGIPPDAPIWIKRFQTRKVSER